MEKDHPSSLYRLFSAFAFSAVRANGNDIANRRSDVPVGFHALRNQRPGKRHLHKCIATFHRVHDVYCPGKVNLVRIEDSHTKRTPECFYNHETEEPIEMFITFE